MNFYSLYKINSMLETPEISYIMDEGVKKFGEKFRLEFIIENSNPEPIQVTSIELEIPGQYNIYRCRSGRIYRSGTGYEPGDVYVGKR